MNTKTEGTMEPATNLADPPWSLLVEQIRNGDASALEQMYRIFSTGIRFYLCRQLGPQDLDDRVHDVFLIIVQSIQKGELREPERLMGYVRTIVRRQVAAQIDDNVKARRNQADLNFGMTLSDHHPNPERNAIEHQNAELALRILHSLPKRDREVLARFYLDEQPPDRICREMGLTETQFRLVKSRAKARFGELGKTRFSRRLGFRS
jgi:RNA polymerase sigma factor (sigma-70 family)